MKYLIEMRDSYCDHDDWSPCGLVESVQEFMDTCPIGGSMDIRIHRADASAHTSPAILIRNDLVGDELWNGVSEEAWATGGKAAYDKATKRWSDLMGDLGMEDSTAHRWRCDGCEYMLRVPPSIETECYSCKHQKGHCPNETND